MTKTNILTLLLCLTLGAASFHAQAQEEAAKPAPAAAAPAKPKKEKRVKMSFGDELISGSSEKPDVSNFNTRTDFNYKKLIRVRENFINEMEGGLDEFKGN